MHRRLNLRRGEGWRLLGCLRLGAIQGKGNQRVGVDGVVFISSARSDDHELLPALLAHESHRRGMRASRQLRYPKFLTVIFVECAKAAVVGRADENQST